MQPGSALIFWSAANSPTATHTTAGVAIRQTDSAVAQDSFAPDCRPKSQSRDCCRSATARMVFWSFRQRTAQYTTQPGSLTNCAASGNWIGLFDAGAKRLSSLWRRVQRQPVCRDTGWPKWRIYTGRCTREYYRLTHRVEWTGWITLMPITMAMRPHGGRRGVYGVCARNRIRHTRLQHHQQYWWA